MCIVFAFQLIRAKEVRIDIEVKRSEEKWREVMTCDVSPVAMFLVEDVPYGPHSSARDRPSHLIHTMMRKKKESYLQTIGDHSS